jgi:hypothetical protein
LEKASPSDRKLLNHYRTLHKNGDLNPRQRRRMEFLADRERERLSEQRKKVSE